MYISTSSNTISTTISNTTSNTISNTISTAPAHSAVNWSPFMTPQARSDTHGDDSSENSALAQIH